MMSFRTRKIRNAALIIVVAISLLVFYPVFAVSLAVQQYYSGWILVCLVLVLLLFGVKKRFANVIGGSNSAWAQYHYCIGWILSFVLLIHVEWTMPQGLFEQTLAMTFSFVFLVGVIGLMLNRTYARRLASLDFEVRYEQIQQRIFDLKSEVETKLLESVKESKSTTLADYYFEELSDYFSDTTDFFEHLIGSSRSHAKRQRALEYQLRYLNGIEAKFVVSLVDFVRQKHVLDCHAALQNTLKSWGILHAPMGMVLVGMILLHIVLVYAFRGAM